MIVLASQQDRMQTDQSREADPFLCRILCIANMYADCSFVDCWVQKQKETGKPTAYLSKMDGVITMFAHENADFDELSMFIKMIGASCIMCRASCARQLHITPVRTGIIMKWNAYLAEQISLTVPPDLQQVYHVLKACSSETFQAPAFEPFYLDMSHKIRHGGATVAGQMQQEKLVACAMTVAETEHTAVIGAVAVLPKYQRQGVGTSVVKSLLYNCIQKHQQHIYVYCNSEKNALFYRSIGFANSGIWAEAEQI